MSAFGSPQASDEKHSTTPSRAATINFKQSLLKFSYDSPAASTEKRKLAEHGPPTPVKRVTRSSADSQASSPGSSPARRSSTTKSPARRSTANPAALGVSSYRRGATSSGGSAPSGRPAPVNRLTDALAPGLLVMFVGVNPGIMTAETGHAYAHPSNLFWRLLHASGLTPRRCSPSETHALVDLYSYGNTNIVTRPTKDASMLSRAEMDEGVAVVEEKVRQFRPEVVCLVGKSIWQAVERAWKGRGKRVEKEFRYGFRAERIGGKRFKGDEAWEGARLFVATTTSGLAAGMSYAEKLEVWRELGEWVEGRRVEMAPKGEDEADAEGSVGEPS